MGKFIFAIALLPVLVFPVACSEHPVPEKTYVSIGAGSETLKLVNMPNNFKYACLTSSEYGQAHLPKGFECYDCQVSEYDRSILEKDWRPDKILLLIRSDNIITVGDIDLNKLRTKELSTSYRYASRNPQKFEKFQQCTSKTNAAAQCVDDAGSCLLMFPEEN